MADQGEPRNPMLVDSVSNVSHAIVRENREAMHSLFDQVLESDLCYQSDIIRSEQSTEQYMSSTENHASDLALNPSKQLLTDHGNICKVGKIEVPNAEYLNTETSTKYSLAKLDSIKPKIMKKFISIDDMICDLSNLNGSPHTNSQFSDHEHNNTETPDIEHVDVDENVASEYPLTNYGENEVYNHDDGGDTSYVTEDDTCESYRVTSDQTFQEVEYTNQETVNQCVLDEDNIIEQTVPKSVNDTNIVHKTYEDIRPCVNLHHKKESTDQPNIHFSPHLKTNRFKKEPNCHPTKLLPLQCQTHLRKKERVFKLNREISPTCKASRPKKVLKCHPNRKTSPLFKTSRHKKDLNHRPNRQHSPQHKPSRAKKSSSQPFYLNHDGADDEVYLKSKFSCPIPKFINQCTPPSRLLPRLQLTALSSEIEHHLSGGSTNDLQPKLCQNIESQSSSDPSADGEMSSKETPVFDVSDQAYYHSSNIGQHKTVVLDISNEVSYWDFLASLQDNIMQSRVPAGAYLMVPLKVVHIAGRILIVPIGHFAMGAFGIGLIFLGAELIYFTPHGPLKYLQYFNGLKEEHYSPLGLGLVVLGGVLIYTSLDYFLIGNIVRGLDRVMW